MQIPDERGALVGGLVVDDDDEIIAITASGQVTRSLVSGVNPTGRGTMGVKFVGVRGDDEVVALARNEENSSLLDTVDESDAEETVEATEPETLTADAQEEE